MHDEHPHPLLAQVPLTVSPFLSLPTATPLPYTYKQLPSTLPPSILSSSNPTSNTNTTSTPDPQQQQQPGPSPAYITSASGQTATPDTILTSCIALQSHLASLESSARSTLQEWEERRRAEDLAEKRRVAPGWLDNDVHLLVPANVAGSGEADAAEGGSQRAGEDYGGGARAQGERGTSGGMAGVVGRRDGVRDSAQGEELDRVFGGLDIK
ncbi:hypothetical protein K491DRAFT_667125 [Lophiostoma macrostomum CBS 122681]|uniref:Uncharacterized protein n=1 Tax=Lophiostoma macrostomum CBS 122681 TaxID=1314788 RepID=A0A6A6SRS4_9PLEO|nr:hypothetical protein K491DRAFT_667125 [Lophiostoma macrostomum CBS 122681]